MLLTPTYTLGYPTFILASSGTSGTKILNELGALFQEPETTQPRDTLTDPVPYSLRRVKYDPRKRRSSTRIKRMPSVGIITRTMSFLLGTERGTKYIPRKKAIEISITMLGGMRLLRKPSAEEKMERRLAQLEEELEGFKFTVGSLAHDMANSLTVITVTTQGLKPELYLNDQARENVLAIEAAAHRIARFVENLRSMCRKPLKDSPKTTNLDLDKTYIEGILKGSNVDLKLISDPEPWPVRLSKDEVDRIIQNLVFNARDSMEVADVKRLTIQTRRKSLKLDDLRNENLHQWGGKLGHYMLISLQDTGYGIDNETIDRIFNEGFTTKKEDFLRTGIRHSGLGLTTVRKLVYGSGGFITVNSTRGQGSEFNVYLPRAEPPSRKIKK